MASRFATVTNAENLQINEEAVPANAKKATELGLAVFTCKILTPNFLSMNPGKTFLFTNAN